MCWIDTVRHIRRVVKRRVGQITVSYQVVEEYILRVAQPVRRTWYRFEGVSISAKHVNIIKKTLKKVKIYEKKSVWNPSFNFIIFCFF